jgi:histidine triad (HIT) family protein
MTDCLFCAIVAGDIPSRQVYADDTAIAFLDIAPWQRGHTLVIPRRHVVSLLEDPSVWGDLQAAIENVVPRLVDSLGAAGLNVLSSAGEAAGQEVFHAHVHLVPRYEDAPGLSNLTRGDSSDLDDVHRQITV